jgi:hypothetical protein
MNDSFRIFVVAASADLFRHPVQIVRMRSTSMRDFSEIRAMVMACSATGARRFIGS